MDSLNNVADFASRFHRRAIEVFDGVYGEIMFVPSNSLYVNRYYNFGGLLQNHSRFDKQTEATIYQSYNSGSWVTGNVKLIKNMTWTCGK